MEPPPFWKELRADFLSLVDHAQGFRVIYMSWRRSAATYGECVVGALGVSIDGKRAYPSWCYHPVQPPRLLIDAAAQLALLATDEGWSDSPYRHHDQRENDTAENRAVQAAIQRLGAALHEKPLQPAEVSVDDLYVVARTAARAAANYLDGKVRYVLCGGPLLPQAESLHAQFRSYAIRGALGSDLVTPDASDHDACNAWLDAIRQKPAGQEAFDTVVETPCHSAAALCERFATESYRRTRATAPKSNGDSTKENAALPDERAATGYTAVAKPPSLEPPLSLQKAARMLDEYEDTMQRTQDKGTIHSEQVGNRRGDPARPHVPQRVIVEGAIDDPAFWRDLQAQFRSILATANADLSAMIVDDVIVLSGGPRDDEALRTSLQNQFRALAIRGGIATDASKERALQAWLERLRERSPWFREVTGSSVVNEFTELLELPVGHIDLPAEGSRVCEEDEHSRVISVDPQPNDRYVVIAGHREFRSALKNGLESVRCRIRTSSTERIDLESGWIDNVLRASAELCTELETEAFARQHNKTTAPPRGEPSKGYQAESDVRWNDIEFRVLSDHRVQVYVAGRAGDVRNFAEMGFGDGRKRNDVPIQAWEILLAFADSSRVPAKGMGATRTRLEKDIQIIRKKLRAIVPAGGEPIPIVSGYYQPVFKITRVKVDR